MWSLPDRSTQLMSASLLVFRGLHDGVAEVPGRTEDRPLRCACQPAMVRVLLLALLCTVALPLAHAQTRKPAPRASRPAAPAIAATDAEAIELTADPAFKSAFSNERVQVYELALDPQASTEIDRRPRDYMVLALTPARFETTNGKNTNKVEMQPEEIQVMKGGWPHKTLNTGDAPLRIVEIVLLEKLDPEHAVCGLAARSCRGGEFGNEIGQYTEAQLFETGTAILDKVEMSAGSEIAPTEHKRDALMIATTPIELQVSEPVTDGQPKVTELKLNSGGVMWFVAGTKSGFKNIGKDDARFLLLELK
jgi:hypothetical protein